MLAGIPGRCSPPNRRIASLYRDILSATETSGHSSRYQITHEATHHGPFVEIPACFVEIGSTEVDWPDPIAGTIWADVLVNNLGIKNWLVDQEDQMRVQHGGDPTPTDVEPRDGDCLDKAYDSDDKPNELVIVSIGGGHYVPRMNDLARIGKATTILASGGKRVAQV